MVEEKMIKVLMEMIGWREKDEREKKIVEIGGMNGFMIERMRGIKKIRKLKEVEMKEKRMREKDEKMSEKKMEVMRIEFI